MPELPEVETIRRYLVQALVGRQIRRVEHLDPRMVKRSRLSADEMREGMVGRTFSKVARRGKFLFASLGADGSLLLHLGMSGRLLVVPSGAPNELHTHMILDLGEYHLRLIDPRRFGRIAWVHSISDAGVSLGVDPLSPRFTGTGLQAIMSGRKVAVKTALLNQALVAGLGNIYADEALFRARIHPLAPAGSLSEGDAERLARAIRSVLRLSLQHGGTSFSDYVNALGHPGENQRYLKVYGREQKPCPRCKSAIQRLVVGGRSSHYCPVCQVARRDPARDESLPLYKKGALAGAEN
jgi:formamidopyrimidine-DNA glycosylase